MSEPVPDPLATQRPPHGQETAPLAAAANALADVPVGREAVAKCREMSQIRDESLAQPAGSDRRLIGTRDAMSPRAIVFGLITGMLICACVPFNDWALANTPLVGNNLPLAVMIVMLLFAVCVNGPLNRRRSRLAWSGGEMSVAFTLMLVMCAVPSTGLMRYLQSNLAVPFALAVDGAAYRKVFDQLGVRSWIYPSFAGATPKDWVGDPLATGFAQRWLDSSRSPYGAWVRPFIAWGVFCGAGAWALLCMASIVLRQWRENEFLPFPLTNIQLALIDAPEPGRWFNRVLGRRSFWIAFAAVLTLHLWNGLHAYFPKQVVEISHGYDLTEVLKETPWSYTDTGLRKATIYFSMIGIAYFLSSPVAVSLWFFVVWMQLWKMFLGSNNLDTALPGINDQRHGVGVAIFCALLWLGRKHWRRRLLCDALQPGFSMESDGPAQRGPRPLCVVSRRQRRRADHPQPGAELPALALRAAAAVRSVVVAGGQARLGALQRRHGRCERGVDRARRRAARRGVSRRTAGERWPPRRSRTRSATVSRACCVCSR